MFLYIVFSQVLLAITGVYSSINVFGSMFFCGFLYQLIMLMAIFDMQNRGCSVVFPSLKDKFKEYVTINYTTPALTFLINALLIIGFYMNVKGAH